MLRVARLKLVCGRLDAALASASIKWHCYRHVRMRISSQTDVLSRGFYWALLPTLPCGSRMCGAFFPRFHSDKEFGHQSPRCGRFARSARFVAAEGGPFLARAVRKGGIAA